MQSQTKGIHSFFCLELHNTPQPQSTQPEVQYVPVYGVSEGLMKTQTKDRTGFSVFQPQNITQPRSVQAQLRYEPGWGQFAPTSALFDTLHELPTHDLDYDIISCPQDPTSGTAFNNPLSISASPCDERRKMPSTKIGVVEECVTGSAVFRQFQFRFLKLGSLDECRLKTQLFGITSRASNHPCASKGNTNLNWRSVVQEVLDEERRIRHIPPGFNAPLKATELWTVVLRVSRKHTYVVRVGMIGILREEEGRGLEISIPE